MTAPLGVNSNGNRLMVKVLTQWKMARMFHGDVVHSGTAFHSISIDLNQTQNYSHILVDML